MTEKEFLNAVCNGEEDVLRVFLDALTQQNAAYCVIGGLAVNAYVEPVVSLDLDVVVAADNVDTICIAMQSKFSIDRFSHSVNLSNDKSALRIQIQTDPRYQQFIEHATTKTVLGYEMRVARVEDVLEGKVWAFLDTDRRASKRQKDLADIARLIEAYPQFGDRLPEGVRNRIV